MEINKLRAKLANAFSQFKSKFVRKSDVSDKPEVNGRSFKLLFIGLVFIFVVIVILLPNKEPVQFEQKIVQTNGTTSTAASTSSNSTTRSTDSATALWAAPAPSVPGLGGAQVNRNTPMILTSGQNAKTQVPAGERLHLQLIDSFTASDNSVPVLARLTFSAVTDSGLSLPAGTEFYGQATFDQATERASIDFSQISLPDGEIKSISGIAVSDDGEPGIKGDVHSDAVKNTAGELITSFVGGLAIGSMHTNFMGKSTGGIQNGMLQAAGDTARNLAQDYGNKLKTQRAWITVRAGTEFDATLNSSLNLQVQPSTDGGIQ